jgi:TonB family protein
VSGLSDQARADLLSQLPVHEGDTLSVESLANVGLVARAFDEHLSISTPSAGGNEVTLEIRALGGVSTTATLPAPSADAGAAPPARIRVGANVQQAKLVSQPRPVYPAEAKQAHIQGVVQLSATIAKDGTMQHLEVIEGHPLLVQAAMDAVRQWVYQPTLLNGQPVEVITQIDVNFTLSQ